MESRSPRLAAVALAALIPTLATARADGPAPSAGSCPAIDPPTPSSSPTSLRAFRDPLTGKLRAPTAEELARIREASAFAPKATQVFSTTVLPDGTTLVDLGNAFLFHVVATRSPDGATRVRCVPRGGAPAPTRPLAEEEK